MLRILTRLQAFLFAPVSAQGFGLMRCAWAAAALAFFLMQWKDVTEFYSSAGVLPSTYEAMITRSLYRFTVLDIVTSPAAVQGVYGVLLLSLLLSMLGILPRLSTIVSFVLMASFHERNTLILGGGDTVLRLVGFLLCIAPNLRAFSVMRLRDQWRFWKQEGRLLPDLTMGAWAYRLLLWQIIVLYFTAVWIKMLGVMWIRGTATTAALQHEVFVRWPRWIMELVIYTAPLTNYLTLIFESAWVLLLIPSSFTRWALNWEFQPRLKRLFILIGFLFHGGILIIMDVGVFSIAMFVAYLGLLLRQDFEAIRATLNKHFSGPIRIFHDGQCGLCKRSVFGLQILDHLKRLSYTDFRNTAERSKYAPDLSLEELDKALHLRFPSGRTESGFNAFRALSWHLPSLWLLAPLLYFPGVPVIGRAVYVRIAARRKRCMHENCGV